MNQRRSGSRAAARCRAAALLLSLLCAALPAGAAEAPRDVPVTYRLEARLDPSTRTVTGRVQATWRNPAAKPLDALYLHLYLNAFASNRTTLMTGMGGRAERWWARHADGWGRIDLAALRVGDDDRLSALTYVQPDDGNRDDHTLARLALAEPLPPGATVELDIDFIATLPRLFLRSGHAAPFFFVAQWFPKLAVWRDGTWQAHQYHAASEFVADFGRYDVTLTVPEDYVLGFTGVAVSERANGDGTRTVHVTAEPVHDFAWTADPRFLVFDESLEGLPVRFLIQPAHRRQLARYRDALHAALARCAAWFGPYPYPALTVVDPGPGGFAAAGMEYPMLFTVGTTWWMPDGVRLPEVLAVHEFIHQYWQGLIASDEVDEPWIDEGVTSYLEGIVLDEAYGRGSYLDLFGLQVDAVTAQRWAYLADGAWDPVTTPSFRMLDRESYASTAYAKTALALRTLGGLVGGQDRVLDALGEFARRWRFAHPRGEDLRATLAALDRGRVEPLLEQVLDGTGVLDYAVARVSAAPVPSPVPAAAVPALPANEPPRYRSEVLIERRGSVRVPVDILVVYDDGSATRETWDGQGRWYRLDATGTRQVAYAVVDPDGALPLDVNRLNNSRMREPGTRGIWRLAGRWGLWLQGALLALSGL